jgi:hypothetical protein
MMPGAGAGYLIFAPYAHKFTVAEVIRNRLCAKPHKKAATGFPVAALLLHLC